MNLRDRLQAALKIFNITGRIERKARRVGRTGPPFRFMPQRTQVAHTRWAHSEYLRDGYEVNELIYAAVTEWRQACEMAPLRLWKGGEDTTEPVDAHPVVNLLQTPNKFQTRQEFIGMMQTFYRVMGEAFVYFEYADGTSAPPTAMYLLPPQRVVLNYNETGITRYLYVPHDSTVHDAISMVPSSVMHIKITNPDDPLDGMGRGLSPLVPLAMSGTIDNDLKRYLRDYVSQGMVPPGFFSKEGVDFLEEDRALLEDEIALYLTGAENASIPSILGGSWSWTPTGDVNAAMVFEPVNNMTEARILMALQVNGVLIGAPHAMEEAAKYSNVEAALRHWWSGRVWPWLTLVAEKMTPYMNLPDDMMLGFDAAQIPWLQDNVHDQISSWSTLVGEGVDWNEAAAAVGLRTRFTVPEDDEAEEDEEADEDTTMLPPEEPMDEDQAEELLEAAAHYWLTGEHKSLYSTPPRMAPAVWADFNALRHASPDDAGAAATYVSYIAHHGWDALQVAYKSMADFRRTIRANIRGLYKGALNRSQFVAGMKAGVRRNYTQAWFRTMGARNTDTLADEEVRQLSALISEAHSHIPGLADRVIDGAKQGKLITKVLAYADKWALDYKHVEAVAMTYDRNDPRLRWKRGPTEEGCRSCKGLDGRVYRASTWRDFVLPRDKGKLECNGYNCLCELVPGLSRPITPGRLPWSLLKSEPLPRSTEYKEFARLYEETDDVEGSLPILRYVVPGDKVRDLLEGAMPEPELRAHVHVG